MADESNRNSKNLAIRVDTLRRWSRVGVIGALVINVLLLIAMSCFLTYYRGVSSWEEAPEIKNLYTQFNLATENVVASWYSSMLLLSVGLMAVACHGTDRMCGRRRFSAGWLILAAIFILLSFDEMGSLHERIGMLGALNPTGDEGLGWVTVLAIPIALVATYMAVFGWMRLRAVPRAFWLFGTGVFLLVLNPFLEEVEMSLLSIGQDSAVRAHDNFLVLEEGAEIFASLCFLASLSAYAFLTPRACGVEAWNVSLRALRAVGIVVPVVLEVALIAAIYVQDWMSEGDSGDPRSWPPSVLAALNSLFLMVLTTTYTGTRRIWGVMAALFCIVVSVFHGACMRYWLAPVADVFSVGLVVSAVCLGVALSMDATWRCRSAVIGFIAIFAVSLAAGYAGGGHLDVLASGVLTVGLVECLVVRCGLRTTRCDRGADRKISS